MIPNYNIFRKNSCDKGAVWARNMPMSKGEGNEEIEYDGYEIFKKHVCCNQDR